MAEYDGSSGALLRRYVPGIAVDGPVVAYEGTEMTNRSWYHTDELGSTIATSDGAGTATTYGYGPYGEPANDNWSGPRFRYTGQISLPEARLYHYKARVYDPKLGRFLQTDPVGYSEGLNLYAYVGNDPVNNVDPSGMQTVSEVVVTASGSGSYGGDGFFSNGVGLSYGLEPHFDIPEDFWIDPPTDVDEVVVTAAKKTCPVGPSLMLWTGLSTTVFAAIVGVSSGFNGSVSIPWSSLPLIGDGSLRGTQVGGSVSVTPLAGIGAFAGVGPAHSFGYTRAAASPGFSNSSSTVFQAGAGDGGGVEVSAILLSRDANYGYSMGAKGAFGVYSAFGQQFGANIYSSPLGCN